MKAWSDLQGPTLLVDVARAKANIHRMVQKAAANDLRLRPHFKTHQAHAAGRWFRDAGVTAIAVSSMDMALYFAADGWTDITVALPVNVRDAARIDTLAGKIDLGVLVDAPEAVTALDAALQHTVHAWIEVDIGDGRSGIPWENTRDLIALAQTITAADNLQLRGILAHAGHSYAARGADEIRAVHDTSMQRLQHVKAALRLGGFPDLQVSTGDTPTCSVAESFPGIDEIRPGNFVYYDLMMVQIGACTHADIAVALACPVVSKSTERQEIVLHGGGVHLSKDFMMEGDRRVYGRLTWMQEGEWQPPMAKCYLRSISQEHGVLKVTPDFFKTAQIGDLLLILPVHSCMTADLMKRFTVMRDGLPGETCTAMTAGDVIIPAAT